MKWIAYFFECLMFAISHVGGAGSGETYMYSVGRESNGWDAVVGGIGMGICIIILAICTVLGRRYWKRKHPRPEYKGYMKQPSQDSANAEQANQDKAVTKPINQDNVNAEKSSVDDVSLPQDKK